MTNHCFHCVCVSVVVVVVVVVVVFNIKSRVNVKALVSMRG